MTILAKHIIHRQIMALTVPDEDITYQEKWAYLAREKVPELIERVCERLNLEKDILKIERLEVNIGTLDEDQWEDSFLEQFENELERMLLEKKATAPFLELPEVVKNASYPEQWIHREHFVSADFFRFLVSGHVDVYPDQETFAGFEEVVLISLAAISRKTLVNTWITSIAGRSQGIERLVRQFSWGFITNFVMLFGSLSLDQWEQLWREFKLLSEQMPWLRATKQKEIFVEVIVRESETEDGGTNFTHFMERCSLGWKSHLNYIEKPDGHSKPGKLKEYTGLQKNSAPETEERVNTDQEPEHLDTGLKDSWYISNGGLIILAPFLPAMFSTLGYINNGRFRDFTSREKALHLTQFLVTGEENPPEYLLTLNKVICGWPLKQPVARILELSDAEKEEGEKLLQAVIAHWDKIGNTSIEGLQETFLRRNAVLGFRKGYDDWLLTVEKKDGIDILIDFIPWTISMVKLPWMEHRITLDWA